MSTTYKTAILVWIVFFVAGGCAGGTGGTGGNGGSVEDTPDFTVDDIVEAEFLSLCLSESLFPLPDVADDIMTDLYEIRAAYGFGALIQTRARDRWTGEIDIHFDPNASHDFAAGGYFFWDELNTELGPLRVVPLEFGRARIRFTRLFNPCIAARLYEEQLGIEMASPVFDPSDGPDVFVGMSDLHGYTYLFRHARDGCQSGCRYVEYYYFRFFDTGPVMIGRWNTADSSPPAWWDEAVDEWISCGCYPQFLESPRSLQKRRAR